jgi:hypothetical protein
VNQDASKRSDQFDIRGDQYFGAGQKFLIWARYTWKNFPVITPQVLLVPSSENANQSRVLGSNVTWSIRPNLVDEAHFGFIKFRTNLTNSLNGKSFTEGLGLIGLQNLYDNGLPEIDFHNIHFLNTDRLEYTIAFNIFIYTDSLT